MKNIILSSLIGLFFTGCVVVDNSSATPEIAPKEKLNYIDSLMVEEVYGSHIYCEDEDNFVEGLRTESKVKVRYQAPYRLTVHKAV